MSRPPRVLLAGAFGQGNPGDESVLDAFVSHLDGCQVAATVGGPPARGPGRYRPVSSADRRAVGAAVLRSDLTVATATVFKVLHPATGRPPLGLLASTLAMAVTARTAGRPLVMAGVGAGNLDHRGAALLTRAVGRSVGWLEVRDEESAAALQAVGVTRPVPVGADVVWATLGVPSGLRRQASAAVAGRPRAVMALSHLAGGRSLVAALRAAAEGLSARGFEVVLHPWQPEQDGRMAAAVAEGCRVPLPVWTPPPDVPAAAARYAGAAVVVGLRFHSLVAAAGAGVPFVAVAHEPKLAGVARRMQQVAVTPAITGADLSAAAVRAASGGSPPVAAVAAETSRAALTLDGVRRAAFASAARRGRRPRLTGGITALGPG